MAVGAVVAVLWNKAFNNGDASWIVYTHLYEIVPGFLLCLLVAWLVSKATWRDDSQILEEFERAVAIAKGQPDPKGLIKTLEEKQSESAAKKQNS